jgi:hypothetical protein
MPTDDNKLTVAGQPTSHRQTGDDDEFEEESNDWDPEMRPCARPGGSVCGVGEI